MTYSEFNSKAWSDHAKDSPGVASRLVEGLGLVASPADLISHVALTTHVYGEHLADWQRGIDLLESFKTNSNFEAAGESAKAVARSQAVLRFASGDENAYKGFSLSDEIRILAVAASALSAHKKAARAADAIRLALTKAETGLSKADPANRSLAVTGWNLACEMEEKKGRAADDVDLMLLAAHTTRKYWEIAGDWKDVEQTEYRLSQSYLQAGKLDEALDHAILCHEICEVNQAPPYEFFFAHEARAVIEKARGNEGAKEMAVEKMKLAFDQLADEDKVSCKASLEKLI